MTDYSVYLPFAYFIRRMSILQEQLKRSVSVSLAFDDAASVLHLGVNKSPVSCDACRVRVFVGRGDVYRVSFAALLPALAVSFCLCPDCSAQVNAAVSHEDCDG